jgi:hypothetical protein
MHHEERRSVSVVADENFVVAGVDAGRLKIMRGARTACICGLSDGAARQNRRGQSGAGSGGHCADEGATFDFRQRWHKSDSREG